MYPIGSAGSGAPEEPIKTWLGKAWQKTVFGAWVIDRGDLRSPNYCGMLNSIATYFRHLACLVFELKLTLFQPHFRALRISTSSRVDCMSNVIARTRPTAMSIPTRCSRILRNPTIAATRCVSTIATPPRLDHAPGPPRASLPMPFVTETVVWNTAQAPEDPG